MIAIVYNEHYLFCLFERYMIVNGDRKGVILRLTMNRINEEFLSLTKYFRIITLSNKLLFRIRKKNIWE
jgi:hypothetical protein